MKSFMKRLAMFGILLLWSVTLSGCLAVVGSAMHDKEVVKFPTYNQTQLSWGEVPSGYGRIVIFAAKAGVTELLGAARIKIMMDNLPEIIMYDQTFVFIDLPVGKHSLRWQEIGSIHVGKLPEFDVLPGEIKCIGPINRGVKRIPCQEAATDLENIRHIYRQPLPYDNQEKSAERVILKW